MRQELIDAVVKQLGDNDPEELRQTFEDISTHSADAGWPGFTYYADTCAFTQANRALIVPEIEEIAEALGETPFSLVRSFGCLKGDTYTDHVLSRALYGYSTDMKAADDQDALDLVENALAWFALEEVARHESEKVGA